MGKPFDHQTLVLSPQKSQANHFIVADQPKQPVHTVSELEQQLLCVNDTLGEEEITTADTHSISQSVNHGPRIVDHLEAKQLSSHPSKRRTEAECTDREPTTKRRNPGRRCNIAPKSRAQ